MCGWPPAAASADVDRGRLGLEHVQSRSGHLPRLDCVGQCLLVDEVSPRGVDQSNALFGSGQALGVHQVTGFFVCRHGSDT